MTPSSSDPLVDLTARVQAFATTHASFNKAMTDAARSVGTAPAAALSQLDAVLADIDPVEQTDLALGAALGPTIGRSREQCLATYRQDRLFVIGMRYIAATMLASAVESERTRSMARAVLANAPEDPFWGTLLEWDAEATLDEGEQERLLDQAFHRRMACAKFLEASRNRSRSAGLAGGAGRMRRQRACFDQALLVATENDLRREAIAIRIFRFRSLLVLDQTGAALDELRQELDFLSRPRGALNDALEATYADGLTALHNGLMPTLLQTAEAFGLGIAALLNVTNADQLATAQAQALAELAAQRDQQRLELLLLAGEFKLRLNNAKWVIEHILPMAEALMQTPEARCRVYSAYADAWEAKGKLPQAIAAARQADEAASAAPSAAMRAQATSRLQGLQAAADEDAVVVRDDAMDPDDFVARRSRAASDALIAKQPARALAILDPLIAIATSDATRGQVLLTRGAAFMDLDRIAEARTDFVAACDLFEPAFDRDPDGESDMLTLRETALLLAATAHARLGETRAAWDSAERARSIKLRHALGIALSGDADWPALREVLATRRAAVMSVATMHWGTLVLSAGSGEAEPQAALYQSFRPPDMNRLLVGESLREDSDVWNSIMTDAIPPLSALLMPALRDRLIALAAGADILYLIPDAALWTAPWAALEVAPGRTLAELIPFALLPFSALLTASSATPAPRRNSVALATGRDLAGYDFVGHLDLLKPLLATLSPRWLAGEAGTTAALRGAGRPDILYLSSHGTIDGETADVNRASRLRLADVEPLPSGDIAGWSIGAGSFLKQLTFLNACQAGRFRSLTRTEMGGFPAAFLRAGRSTLIAPLTHVDPHAAGGLAVAFFKAYLTGFPAEVPTAARALQTARLAVRDSGAPPSDWAAHTMFGVDC